MGGAMRAIKMSGERQLWLLSALILIAALCAPTGFSLIDEAVYYLGARSLSESGSLGFNVFGTEQFHSASLKLRLIVLGPQGFTPQYPAGTALLAAPLLPWLGPRAFILPNAIAAILTLFTVRKICLSQFKDEKVARIAVILLVAGTFWVEYAIGIWPHAISAYFAVQAYWFALRHLESDSKRYVILAGVFAGLGMPFRLDAILAVPAIGLILVLFAPRFIRSSFWFGLGVLPSIALVSILNLLKFGTLNPISYGKSGGNVDLWSYGPFAAALAAAFAALLVWRNGKWKIERKVAVGVVLVVGVLALLIPATNAWLMRFWNGFLALVIDLRTVDDHRAGIEAGAGGTVMFWGLVKKALGQSMPWIGLLAFLMTGGIPKEDRRFFATSLIVVTTMTLPFILLSWHGGGASNMRYFLPSVPLLCILCARLFVMQWSQVSNPLTFAAAGVWAAVAIGISWYFLHPSGAAGVQQIVSTYALLTIAAVAAATGVTSQYQQSMRKLLVAVCCGGFILSMTSSVADLRTVTSRRAFSADVRETIGKLPPKSLVIGLPEWTTSLIGRQYYVVADREPISQPPDPNLIRDALDSGYRVFTTSNLFFPRLDLPAGVEAVITDYTYPEGRIIELRRVSAPERHGGFVAGYSR